MDKRPHFKQKLKRGLFVCFDGNYRGFFLVSRSKAWYAERKSTADILYIRF